MNAIVGGLLSDCLGAKGIPTGTIGAAVAKLIGRRHDMLRHIISSEIRQGNFDNVDQDELVSIFFRLIRDAEEGVARNNLSLMAKVINGMAEKKELTAPNFLKYANVLSGLTEDEITVLGIMVKHSTGRYYYTLCGQLHEQELSATPDAGSRELEKILPNYKVIQQSLTRTALVEMRIEARTSRLPSGARKLYGGEEKIDAKPVYVLTPFMEEILRYTDFFPKESHT